MRCGTPDRQTARHRFDVRGISQIKVARPVSVGPRPELAVGVACRVARDTAGQKLGSKNVPAISPTRERPDGAPVVNGIHDCAVLAHVVPEPIPPVATIVVRLPVLQKVHELGGSVATTYDVVREAHATVARVGRSGRTHSSRPLLPRAGGFNGLPCYRSTR